MTKRKQTSGPAILLLLAALTMNPEIRAEEAATVPIESVVVSASRLANAQSVFSTIVLDAAQIEERQPSSVVELLRQLPGVSIFQQGGPGGISNVMLRGGESNFTVVMIDGVKVNDPTTTRGGAYDFSNVSIAGIERVEIVRGPMSSIYGSDALAGVIQIFTRDAEAGRQISLQVGSDNYLSVAGTFSEHFSAGSVALTLHANRDDSDVAGASWEARGLNARFDSDFGDTQQVSLFLRLNDSDSTSFPEDSGGPELAVLRDIDARNSREEHFRAAWSISSLGSWNLDVDASSYRRKEVLNSPGIAAGRFGSVPASFSESHLTREHIAVTLRTQENSAPGIAFGAEWQRENGESLGTLDVGFPLSTDFRLERSSIGMFAEATVKLNSVILAGSTRIDNIDGIASEITTRLGAAYQFPDGKTVLHANWGQGFKAPSFFALASPLIGNPGLRAEFAESSDIWLQRHLGAGGAELNISLYRNTYRDLVDFNPVTFSLVNRSSVVTKGAELSVFWPLSEILKLRGHLSYLDSDIRNSDAKLRSRPKWRGGVVVDWVASKRWEVVTSVLVVDEFYESSIPTATTLLEGYLRVDLALTRKINDRLTLHFSVDNLLNADYKEAVGFPAAGIRGRIRIRHAF